jgi:TonB family protein
MSSASNTRNPNRPLESAQDRPSCIVQPRRYLQTLFSGWGPKLFASALAAGFVSLAHGNAMAAEGVRAVACAASHVPAAAISSPIPEFPPIASIEKASGTAFVFIHLAANGDLQSATISRSSGNVALDREALRVTRSARFTPETVNCTAIEGAYLYQVDFDA